LSCLLSAGRNYVWRFLARDLLHALFLWSLAFPPALPPLVLLVLLVLLLLLLLRLLPLLLRLLHDISTDCSGGRSFYDLGGIFTYQTARKAPAIHWGSPIGSQKNIFSVLVDHFRAPEHPCGWWLQRSSRRRW
jgi:hypothetical protein